MTQMSPIDWAKRPLQKYADFSGRAPRPEYWWFVLAQIVLMLVAMLLDSMLGSDIGGTGFGIIYVLVASLCYSDLAVRFEGFTTPTAAAGGYCWSWSLISFWDRDGNGGSGDSATGLGMAGLVGILALAGAIAILVFMILPGRPATIVSDRRRRQTDAIVKATGRGGLPVAARVASYAARVPLWRNGRRARLKIEFLTGVSVRVGPGAPVHFGPARIPLAGPEWRR